MELNDQRLIEAAPAHVWAAILDAEVLKACVPGCESLSGSPEAGFDAVVVQKVGPVKARFQGRVEISDIIAGEALTLSGEGKGGAAGFAKGSARVTLTAEEDKTRLSYVVEARVGGKLAQLGSRLIDGFAKKMADDFFARLQRVVENPAVAEAVPAEIAPADGAAEADAEIAKVKKSWLKRIVG